MAIGSEAGMATVRELRERKALSQEDLARAAGLSWGTVSRIERGEVGPNFRTRRAIAAALGVEPDAIEWPEGKAKDGE